LSDPQEGYLLQAGDQRGTTGDQIGKKLPDLRPSDTEPIIIKRKKKAGGGSSPPLKGSRGRAGQIPKLGTCRQSGWRFSARFSRKFSAKSTPGTPLDRRGPSLEIFGPVLPEISAEMDPRDPA